METARERIVPLRLRIIMKGIIKMVKVSECPYAMSADVARQDPGGRHGGLINEDLCNDT